MTDPEHYRKLERLYAAVPVSQWYGATTTVAEDTLLHGAFRGVFTRSTIALDRSIGYA